MENPFSWDYLTSAPGSGEIFGPLSTLFLIFCAVGLVAGFLLSTRPQIMWSRRLLRVNSTRKWGSIFMWIFSIGMFFFIIRWLQINPFTFGNRIWLYLTALAAIIAVMLMVVQIRYEAAVLAEEHKATQQARAKGIHGRRPPRRSRNKLR
ncbi:MAG TPA: hypothetical protein VD789_11520 [Thermomicrobiales bacterium]|nr:hypothetical protein [Thermomicrobiales bacterium]